MTLHKNPDGLNNKEVQEENKNTQSISDEKGQKTKEVTTINDNSNFERMQDKSEQLEMPSKKLGDKNQKIGIDEKNNGNNQNILNDKPKKNKKAKRQNNATNQFDNKEEIKVMQTFEQFKIKNMKSLNKDLALKYYSKLLLNSMGYYCDLEVNIFTQSFNQKYKKEQISDIDVLGCRIDNDLSISLIPVECKSGEDGALDELLKLKGVMDYLGSQKGYLIKNKIATNAREMGEKVNVSTLDNSEIRQLLHNLALLESTNDKWVETQIENYLKEKYICENAVQFKRAIEYIKNDYWHEKNFRNIQNIIFLASIPRDVRLYETNEGKYVLLQLSKYLSLSIIQLASFVIHKNYGNSVDKIKEYLFGGARERREREMLFDKVNQILASESRPPQNFEPAFMNDFIELSLRFMTVPGFSKQVPACLENCLHTFIMESAGYDKNKIVNRFKSITLKLAKDVIIFICKQANVKQAVFNEILNL